MLEANSLVVFQLTTKLLPLNPEYYTIWNVRRRCLISSLLSRVVDQRGSDTQEQALNSKGRELDCNVLQSELVFTIPLLTKFPKCYWSWEFRRWILSQVILRLSVPVARKIWEMELNLVSKFLSKDERNFHAWGYRRLVVAKLESPELSGKSIAKDEFAYTTKMIRHNLSNFSAWHSRSQLIPRILEEQGTNDKARAEFLIEELSLVREGLNVGPEDQSLWYYHNFLMLQVVDHGNRQTIAPALTVDERVAHVKHEIDEIKELLEDYSDTKWLYVALLEYTLALDRLEECTKRDVGVFSDLHSWLAKLRALDPMRMGRWNDVEKEIGSWSS